ncbi:hypothetical protein AAVH_41852, partial [Aphelenchoides avenae]
NLTSAASIPKGVSLAEVDAAKGAYDVSYARGHNIDMEICPDRLDNVRSCTCALDCVVVWTENGSPQCASSCNCINYCASTDFIIVFCPQVRTASTQLSSTNPVTWPQLNTGSTSKMPMPASSTQPTESCPAGWTYSDVTRKCYR